MGQPDDVADDGKLGQALDGSDDGRANDEVFGGCVVQEDAKYVHVSTCPVSVQLLRLCCVHSQVSRRIFSPTSQLFLVLFFRALQN